MKKITVIEAEALFIDDPEKMLKEYDEMRDEAEKRIADLQASEFSWTKASQKKLPPPSDFIDPRDIPKAFSEVSKFLSAKSSTVKGQREIQRKTIKSLNRAIGADTTDEDYDPDEAPEHKVNKKNLPRLIKLLERAREQKITYDSEKLVELADITLGMNDSMFDRLLEDIEWAVRNMDELEEVDMEGLDEESFADLRRKMR